MNGQTSNQAIRARVEAFVSDFARWNAKFYRPGRTTQPLNWDKIRREFEILAARHFAPNATLSGAGSAIGWPPEHSPEHETIISIIEQSDQQAIVETKLEQNLTTYYEYTMHRVGDEWRIAGAQMLRSSKEERVKDLDLDALACKLPKPVLAKDFPAGLDRLFQPSVRLRTRDGVASTKTVLAGTLRAPSGFLAGDDPGRWQWGVAVFQMRIPSGSHDIELVIDDRLKIVGAARITFGGRENGSAFARATRAERTRRAPANSHVISVDGGMVGLADAGAIIALSRRDRERLYTQLAHKKRARGAGFIPLAGSLRAWTIDSGCGDGGYAAYWHLDENGRPLSLIFGFADLALPIWETVQLPFELKKPAGLIKLKSQGVALRFGTKKHQRILSIRSRKQTRTRMFDSNGQLVFDSEGYGCSICGDETIYHLPQGLSKKRVGALEVQIYLGHRYEIIEP